MKIDERILELVQNMPPITLAEMKDIRLMNRTDTKFVTNKEKLARLLELANGKYYAQSIDGKRISSYMTTYWDTDDHFFYTEHHNKRSPRQKVRVRTYLDSGITFLEIKTKNNHGRTKKKRVEVPSQDVTPENGNEEFVQGIVHRSLNDIRPMVRNQFHRITLVNFDKTERLTIDFDVQFDNFETGNHDDVGNLVVVELKRDGNVFSPILELLRQLRIKPSGFSKYAIGSAMTNKGLKQNLFKARLVKFRKIQQQKV